MRIALPAVILLALAGCNEPPGAPDIAIEPAEPTTLDGLTAVITRDAVDPNKKDVVSYRYAWAVDGQVQPDLTGPDVPADRTERGQTWALTVTPADDKLDGPATTTSITILNALPTAEITIDPAAPLSTDDLLVVINPADPDGDTVTSFVSWTRDGEDVRIQSERVPADRTVRGEVWEVTVVPSDPRGKGEPVTASVQIANQAPEIAQVTLRPETAFEGSILEALVDASDYDGDDLTYTATWSVNGVELPGIDASELDGSSFDRDDEVSVSIVANDGLSDSAPVSSEAVVIQNTPPRVESATISPEEAREGDTLSCEPSGWSDDDGDAEQFQYEWRAGTSLVGSSATLGSEGFGKGDRISCVLIPFDGLDTGTPVTSRPIVIRNTPPTVATVTIAPSAPETGTTITATVSGISDVDDDAVRLDIDWYVDGTKVASGSSLSGEYYRKNQTIYAEVRPYDGTDYGARVKSATVTSVNAPPRITSFALGPVPAYTDSALSASVTTFDADGDPVTLSYAWTKNGSSYGTTTTRSVPSSDLERGDAFAVTVTPNDGTVSGASSSGTATIVNKAPTTPTITLTPTDPEEEDDLVCTITSASTDADGDTLTTTLSWKKDGVSWTGTTSTTTTTGDTIPSSETASGEDWECTVSVTDGTATVSTAEEVTVSDRDGQVRTVSGTWIDVKYAQCGSGTTCTATQAEKACTDIGMKVASHASNGTSAVKSLGATSSCSYSVSYFTTDETRGTGDCLVGIANLRWSSCCGTSRWHGRTMKFGSASSVFGYVRSGSSGYVSSYPSTAGTNWACYSLSTSARPTSGCTKMFVACVD